MAHERQSFGAKDGQRLGAMPGEVRSEYIEKPTGLRLRVTAKGARSWLVVFWSAKAKNTRRLKLGDAATMPLAKARAAARAALHAVEQEGRDPFAERQQARGQELEARKARAVSKRAAAEERKRRSTTFAKVCADFIQYRRTTPSGRKGVVAKARSVSQWTSLLNVHVAPAIGSKTPDEITPEDVVLMLEQAGKRGGPSVPRDALAFVQNVWNWMTLRTKTLGVRLPSIPPFADEQIKQIGARRKARDRVLSAAEIWRLWKATDGDREASSLRLILLTACRVREGTLLPSSEINLAASVWKLPAGALGPKGESRNKASRERLVPLSKQALAVVKEAIAGATDGTVFGGIDADEFMPHVRERMRELAPDAFVDFQARDLRATAATRLELLGVDPYVVAIVLDHAIPDPRVPAVTMNVYIRSQHRYEAKVRGALELLGAWVAALVKSKRPPKDD